MGKPWARVGGGGTPSEMAPARRSIALIIWGPFLYCRRLFSGGRWEAPGPSPSPATPPTPWAPLRVGLTGDHRGR